MCPMCGKPTLKDMRPFCSKRCADIDLAEWLNESYAIASQRPEDAVELEAALERDAAQSCRSERS